MNVPVVSHLKLLVNLYNKMNNRFLVLLVIYLIIYLLSVLYKNKQIFCAILLSLLSWERGLKLKNLNTNDCVIWSLLSWECELKYQHMNLYTIIICCVIVELVVKSIFIAITLLINNTIDKYCCKPVNSRYNIE